MGFAYLNDQDRFKDIAAFCIQHIQHAQKEEQENG